MFILATLLGVTHVMKAQDSSPITVTVRTFDCRGADVNDLGTCKPLAGVPMWWFTLTEGYPKMTQTRYTNDDGTDSLELPGMPRVHISYDGLVDWTSEDLVNLGQTGYTFFPDLGESVTLDFLFVTAEENVRGRTPVTIRTLDCSQGDPADVATCEPMRGIYVSAHGVAGIPTFSNVSVTDDKGEVLLNWGTPQRVLIAIPLDQSCSPYYANHPNAPTLVPSWNQESFWLVTGDERIYDVIFMPGEASVATPVVDYLSPLVEQKVFDPCADG
jgi:hypothetical protein